jgi:DNA-binding PucR family transcriptional regulator
MDELWSPPGTAAAAAIRAVCERLIADAEALADTITESAAEAQGDPALLADAALHAEDRELNRSDLVQWLSSNIHHPGARVEPYVGPRTVAYIGDLVSRGIAPEFAAGWRAAFAVAWRRWIEECIASIDDRDVLAEVLDVSAHSFVQYALDSVSVLREVSLASAMGNAGAQALAMIQLIASGTPMTADLAEERLSYRLDREHVALVLWADDPAHGESLDGLIGRLRGNRPARTMLVARASAASRWVWLSGPALPDDAQLEGLVHDAGPVHASVGRRGHGLDGFRSSHQDALAGQALLTRLGSDRRFTAYASVELVDSLTRDRDSAARFVVKTLGPLADADASLRQALLTYVQCGFSTTRTAARLYLHRNTVERRVSKADELSAVKLGDNPVHVCAALLVLDLVPDIVTTSAASAL